MIRDQKIHNLPLPLGDDRRDAGGRATQGAVAEGSGEGGVRFTEEQLRWLEMIRDHIAANLNIALDDVQDAQVSREAWMQGATDFEYAPFSQKGGLGKVHQLFGRDLAPIIETLNTALVA